MCKDSVQRWLELFLKSCDFFPFDWFMGLITVKTLTLSKTVDFNWSVSLVCQDDSIYPYIYNKLDQNERKQYDCNETRSLGFDFPRDSTTLHATTKMANWQNFAEILWLNSFQKKTTSFSNIQLKSTLCAKMKNKMLL